MRSTSAEAPAGCERADEMAPIHPAPSRQPGKPTAASQLDPTAVYLVVTSGNDDPAARAAAAAGLRMAGEAGAAVVLYDRSAESAWIAPYDSPTRLPEPLGVEQLRGYGRARLADQLEAIRASGLNAHATLPWGTGPAAMATACQELGVTHVILPATLSRPSLRDRLLHRTLEDYQARLTGVRIALVDERGSLTATGQRLQPRVPLGEAAPR